MTRPRLAIALALLVLAVLIVTARLHTYDEPLEDDVMVYAVIAHELHAGRALYADAWDHKPPGVHVTYWIAEALFGYGRDAVFALVLAAALATLGGVYLAGAALGGRAAGLWAATCWAIASGDLWLQANQPNTEVFVNACLAWAFALLVAARGDSRAARYLAIGALIAWASLYKQVVVAPALFLVLAHVVRPPEGRSRARAAGDVALIAAVGLAAWAAVFSYFTAVGRLAEFYEAVFAYNRYYGRRMPTFVLRAFDLPRLVVDPYLQVLVPLAALTLVGALAGWSWRPRRPWTLLAALVLATPIAVGMHGQFVPHYFQLWLPPLTIGAGWAVAALGARFGDRLRWAPAAAGGAALVVLLAHTLPSYGLPADDWSVIKYGPIFVEERTVARRIDALLLPGETFYEWGSEVGLFFESRRRPPTAFSVWPVVDGPAARRLGARVRADLDRDPPEIFVVAKWTQVYIQGRHPVLDFLAANYRPLRDQDPQSAFLLFARRGGALEQRLAVASAR